MSVLCVSLFSSNHVFNSHQNSDFTFVCNHSIASVCLVCKAMRSWAQDGKRIMFTGVSILHEPVWSFVILGSSPVFDPTVPHGPCSDRLYQWSLKDDSLCGNYTHVCLDGCQSWRVHSLLILQNPQAGHNMMRKNGSGATWSQQHGDNETCTVLCTMFQPPLTPHQGSPGAKSWWVVDSQKTTLARHSTKPFSFALTFVCVTHGLGSLLLVFIKNQENYNQKNKNSSWKKASAFVSLHSLWCANLSPSHQVRNFKESCSRSLYLKSGGNASNKVPNSSQLWLQMNYPIGCCNTNPFL